MVALALGLAFAGSADRLASGVRVAGVEVSGLSVPDAKQKLEARAASVAAIPVTFTAGSKAWRIAARDLDVAVDWNATLDDAQAAGNWPQPFRGLKRIELRLFGADVDPTANAFDAGVAYKVKQIAAATDRLPRSASIALDGLTPHVVQSGTGLRIDREAASETIVDTLAGFSRKPVALPVVTAEPAVTADDLQPVLAQVRTALSAPVRFGWAGTRWSVQPDELAKLLRLPADGRTKLEIGGPYAETYFERLSAAVGSQPRNASFAVNANRSVRVVPAREGRVLDVAATAKALLAAALSTDRRNAGLVIVEKPATFTTEKAKSLRVTRELSRYSTYYAGDADRITNLKRAVQILNGTRIAPGAEFSFNAVVGQRTEARGFRPAPVIVGGEYEVGVGGGVSQVATTTFNAAWEAGLKITQRTAHALYIARYPAGRDATVNYPDVDLKFRNDTDEWLVVEAFPTRTGISVGILGGPTGRRVVSDSGDLEVAGPPRIKRVPDPGLFKGEKVIEDYGEPARDITVRRIVYENGKVLYDESWYTFYRSEPRIVRYGTIPVTPPKPPPTQTGTTQTGTTQTGTTGGTTTGHTTTGPGN
jgi:vancomycin resistance protein YoaR